MPHRITFTCLFVVFIMTLVGTEAWGEQWLRVEGHAYKNQSSDGYCNCVFASKIIEAGQEGAVKLGKRFTSPEPVFARCYFPGKIGPLEAKDFWHEIWIDGHIRKRTVFKEPPDPNQDQTQIWVTDEDYAEEMKSLKPGRHEVVIWVLKNELNDSGKVKWAPIKLSKGVFYYQVP